MRKTHIAGCLILAFFATAHSFADSSREESAAGGEPRLELGGALEVEYSLLGSRKDSPAYKLQYFGKDAPDLLSAYPLTLYLNGDYETGEIGVHVKTATTVSGENDPAFSLLELYGNYHLSDSTLLQSGKKVLRWGKGYAFNPVAYVSPAKDPEDPEASLEGYPLIGYQYSRSFQSDVLNNFGLDLVVLPAGATAASKAGDAENTSAAGKLYFLLWDTDVDFLAYYGKNEPLKYGMDISRNLTSGLEVHGEFSRFHDQPKYTIDGGALRSEEVNGFAYLAGLRWLNEWNVTTIIEYYHNSAGLSKDEFEAYQTHLETAASGGTNSTVSQAMIVNKTYFSTPNPMSDYLYLKVTKPEPFDLVDFAVSAYSIYNIIDTSASVGLLFSYKPVTNLEVVFQPVFLLGSDSSEFGSKQYLYKVVLQAKYSF